MARVRRAHAGDVDALIAMGRALHDESPRYRGMAYQPDKLRRLADHLLGTLLADAPGAIFVAEEAGAPVGMFVAVIGERFFSGERFVTDLAVYVRPEQRGSSAFARLVRAMEQWAQQQGLSDIAVGVSTEVHADKTVHAYERLGYRLSGYTVTKTVHGH